MIRCQVHFRSEHTAQCQVVTCTAGVNTPYIDRMSSVLLEWTHRTVIGRQVYCWSEHCTDMMSHVLLEWTHSTVTGCQVYCWSEHWTVIWCHVYCWSEHTLQWQDVKCTVGVNTGQWEDVRCTAGMNTGQRQDVERIAGVNNVQCQNVNCLLLVQTQGRGTGASIAQSVWLADCCLDGPGFESRSSQDFFF